MMPQSIYRLLTDGRKETQWKHDLRQFHCVHVEDIITELMLCHNMFVTYDSLSLHHSFPMPASLVYIGRFIVIKRDRYLDSVVAAALDKWFWTMTPLIMLHGRIITSTIHCRLSSPYDTVWQQIIKRKVGWFMALLTQTMDAVEQGWARFNIPPNTL